MSSPESHHSIGSQFQPSDRQHVASKQYPQSSGIPGLLQQQQQQRPLPPSQPPPDQKVVDVESWLARPENVALLERVAKERPLSRKVPMNSPQPPLLPPQAADGAGAGATTSQQKVEDPSQQEGLGLPVSASQAIVDLHEACQRHGLTPAFDIVEVSSQRFQGTLQIADQTITLDTGPLPSKRDVKGVLAGKGLAFLNSRGSVKPAAEVNWVGRLGEYLTTLSGSPEVTYIPTTNGSEGSANSTFSCEVQLSLLLHETTQSLSFQNPGPSASKKAAKASAAKEAIQYLINIGELAPDGRLVKRANKLSTPRILEPLESLSTKKAKPNTFNQPIPDTNIAIRSIPTPAAVPAEENPKTETYASRVTKLLPGLGLSPPEYRIELADGAKNLYSAAAYFDGTIFGPEDQRATLPGGPIGEVRNVYGHKNAREECAKLLVGYLEEESRRRMRALAESFNMKEGEQAGEMLGFERTG